MAVNQAFFAVSMIRCAWGSVSEGTLSKNEMAFVLADVVNASVTRARRRWDDARFDGGYESDWTVAILYLVCQFPLHLFGSSPERD